MGLRNTLVTQRQDELGLGARVHEESPSWEGGMWCQESELEKLRQTKNAAVLVGSDYHTNQCRGNGLNSSYQLSPRSFLEAHV